MSPIVHGVVMEVKRFLNVRVVNVPAPMFLLVLGWPVLILCSSKRLPAGRHAVRSVPQGARHVASACHTGMSYLLREWTGDRYIVLRWREAMRVGSGRLLPADMTE
jgi:hypothetical protein